MKNVYLDVKANIENLQLWGNRLWGNRCREINPH